MKFKILNKSEKVSYLHEGLVDGAGELLMLDLHSAGRKIRRSVSVEIKSRWKGLFVVDICGYVVLDL